MSWETPVLKEGWGSFVCLLGGFFLFGWFLFCFVLFSKLPLATSCEQYVLPFKMLEKALFQDWLCNFSKLKKCLWRILAATAQIKSLEIGSLHIYADFESFLSNKMLSWKVCTELGTLRSNERSQSLHQGSTFFLLQREQTFPQPSRKDVRPAHLNVHMRLPASEQQISSAAIKFNIPQGRTIWPAL